jgi:hypothetical protein
VPRRPLTPEVLAAAVAPACRALERALADHAPAHLLPAWRARLGAHHSDAALRRGLAQAATYAAVLARHAAPQGWLAQALADVRAAPALAPALTLLDHALAAAPHDPAVTAPSFHLFEHLLAACDAATRSSVGAYYTPIDLVHAQLALTGAALHQLGLDWTHDRVHIIDPACGAGIYPHTLLTRAPSIRPDHLHASELLPGPAIAAHGHLTAAGLAAPNIHCHDTLTAELPPFTPTDLLVCIGNPPYSRHPPRAAGSPRLSNFLPEAGAGIHTKNLYNDYIHFWHWAFKNILAPGRPGGLVCFVTAASYLRGPGFAAMRQHIRAQVDDLWILDLGGDSLGPQRSPNIFKNVRIPVCIALAVRRGERPAGPATIHYTRLADALSRADRLRLLAEVRTFADLEWTPVTDPSSFIPTPPDHADWPRLTDLFPWRHSGAQFKRTWPVGETRELLHRRWRALLTAPDRAAAFRETRDRTVAPLAALPPTAPPPELARYAFRSFDRQWCLLDPRLGDFLRPPLWHSLGDRQIFLTSLLSVDAPSSGPALVATAHIPDLHHYSGRGGADVLPLYHDPAATVPNLRPGLLAHLHTAYRREVTPEDFVAYIYAVLAHPAYTALLREPGPRVPLTADPALFTAAAELGRELLRWHTYGARMNPNHLPLHGTAAATVAPNAPYPAQFTYDPTTQSLHIDQTLIINNLPPEIFSYDVSGLKILPSWLGYRMQRPRGRASSPLDALRPAAWTPELTRELLELCWILEHTLRLHPHQSDLLIKKILAAPLLTLPLGPGV